MAQNHRRESAWGFDSLRPHCEMHPATTVARVLELSQEGLNECEISRRTGINRRTINDWTSGKLPHSFARKQLLYGRRSISDGVCPQCGGDQHDPVELSTAYVYLLGLYLGDGCISRHARAQCLRICLDLKYPGIIEDTCRLLKRCFPENGVATVPSSVGLSTFACVYSKHLECLFPQHGSGLKHRRRVALEPWQTQRVKAAPWAFLRGCIRSDGCAFINRTDVHRDQPYEYLSYCFSNRSKDIVDLFTTTCDLVGIRDYRVTSDQRPVWHVRINRRASVRLMFEHVGLKT
jgi:hypothetical protein